MLHRELSMSAGEMGVKAAGGETRPEHNVSLSLAIFAMGIVIGLGLANGLGDEFVAGLVILAVLSLVLAMLGSVKNNTRKRLTAGEASYRAFFEHAVEGIFRTTPEGHYLAVNQALAQIYGYGTPEALRSEEHTSELQSRQYRVCRL